VFDACLDIEWWDLGKNQVREVKVINDGNTRGVYPLLFSANNRALIIKQGLGTVCF
jgi:5-methylthioribose kinase